MPGMKKLGIGHRGTDEQEIAEIIQQFPNMQALAEAYLRLDKEFTIVVRSATDLACKLNEIARKEREKNPEVDLWENNKETLNESR